MAEGKAVKATMVCLPHNIVCPECRFVLYVEWEGKTAVVVHGEFDSFPCPNAGKKFKVATVELEEMC